MKISLNWLTDYVDVSGIRVEDLAERLTHIGLCCDAVQQTESDVVLELDVTANRPDCLGHIGVAREAAAAFGLPLKLPDVSDLPAGGKKVADLTSVEVLAPDLCPRYTARVITGVKVGPSPVWMVERLQAVGLRSVNNVVDVTNYVLLEYSQPLHSFDYDLLAGGRIIVRRARPGEEIVSIDGTRCALTERMLVIADAEKPVAVAGIMGGLESEIAPETRNILLESAQFDPLTTRKSARALRLGSESSYRFERGVDPVAVDSASRRACRLILQLGGGDLADGVVDVWARPYRPVTVSMRTARCRALLGAGVGDREQFEILNRLGLSPRAGQGEIACAIPSHRADLQREVDLIEEVARLYGLDRIPQQDSVAHRVQPPGLPERARRALREVLSAAGLDEAVTFSFLDDSEAELFGVSTGVHVDPAVRRTNNLLRPTLLPSLLRVCKNNQDVGNEDVSVYELAAVFLPGKPGDALPDEHVSLGLVTCRDARYLRGVLEAVAARLAPQARLEVVPAPVPGLAEGASAALRLDGKAVGVLGAVDARVLGYYGLERPYAAAAVRFDEFQARSTGEVAYRPLARLPGVRRDLSVVTDEAVAWRQLEEAIRSVEQPGLESVDYVDTYRGSQVPPGKKSVTLSLTYRLPGRTLRHEEVDGMVARVTDALGNELGATLRQ